MVWSKRFASTVLEQLFNKQTAICCSSLGGIFYKVNEFSVTLRSTSGPLLFLTYINDLLHACNLRFRLFVEAASLTMSDKSKNAVRKPFE